MLSLLLRLLNRIRPPDGWLIWSLAMIAVLCLPASLVMVNWVQGTGVLVGIAVAAALVGLVLVHLEFPGWLAGLLLGALGLGSTVAFAGRAAPPALRTARHDATPSSRRSGRRRAG